MGRSVIYIHNPESWMKLADSAGADRHNRKQESILQKILGLSVTQWAAAGIGGETVEINSQYSLRLSEQSP